MDKIYPADWPCKNCKYTISAHVQIGDLNEEGPDADLPANLNWCFSKRSLNYTTNPSTTYQPVDNLTYIELLAKAKEVLK